MARYILRRTLAYFALALVIVLAALSLERLMRLVEEVTNQGAPVSAAVEVLVYLIPHYLELAVPAALFLAVLFAVRRLHATSELLPMLAAGFPLRRVTRAMVGLALVLTVFTLLNVSYLQPHSRYAYRATLADVTDTGLALGLQPGVFRRVNDKLVIRADQVSDAGRTLTRFFAEAEPEPGARTVVVARRARLMRETGTGELVVKLVDGDIVRTGARNSPNGSISFRSYTWKPPVDDTGAYGARGQDARELTVPELLRGATPVAGNGTDAAERAAELHTRLVHAVSLVPLAILAVPLALLGRGRTGRAYGIGVGVVVLVLYQKVLSFGENFAAEGVLAAPPALWGPFAVLTLAALTWALMIAEGGPRGALRWITHPRQPPRMKPRTEG